jgi:hypothetical protein
MTENKHTEALLTSKWFVVLDDLIGGWAVATVDKPLSEINFREPGVYVVAEMISKDMADYIVFLHEQQRRL